MKSLQTEIQYKLPEIVKQKYDKRKLLDLTAERFQRTVLMPRKN